ncbi:MAG: ribosomal L7Ae/L30e/S12e/Gadd45 family protein [Candidatus Woesearchaeota archaeon]
MTKTDSALDIIRNAHKKGAIVIGNESTMNAIRNDKLEYVFIARNAPKNMIEDIMHNAEIMGVKASQVSANSEDLGIACRKQFRVTMVGVLKK